MFMFKQLFDESSSTLTYLVVDEESKEAVIIDPVRQHVEEYLRLVRMYMLTISRLVVS
jgi:sulfur dioxygenase